MRKTLMLFLMFCGLAQITLAQQKISGIVTSRVEGPLPGVSVSVKGSTNGIITDINGKYSLTVPDKATLIFSYIGMKKQEILTGGKSVLDVVLEPDVLGLDEVVVTAIGISREKKSLGYAVQDVSGDKINNAETGNVLAAITGKVAGVNITSSAGASGAASFINIRGQNSITGSNQPLFVVDGVPIDNSMDYSGNPDLLQNNLTEGYNYSNRAIDLNPDDIKTISVLKGGAATALYGMRAGNGAIIITTKKGSDSNGKMSISIASSVSVDKVNKLPEMQMMYAQGNNGVYGTATPNTWGPRISDLRFDGATDYERDKHGALVPASSPSARQDMPAIAYDNPGNFFLPGLTFNNNVSFSGGSNISNFFFSIGNNSSKGIIPRNTFGKTSVKFVGETKMGDKLRISASANYVRSGGNRVQQGSNTSGVMLGLFRCTPTFDNSNGHGSDGYKYADAYMYTDGSPRRYAGYDNPYWTVNKNNMKDQVDRVISYAFLEYKPFTDFTLSYRIGDDFYSDRRKGHTALMSANLPDGQQEEDFHYNNSINSDLTMNYSKQLLEGLSVNATAGQNMYQSYVQQIYNQGNGFVIPDFYHMSATASQLVRERTTRYRTAAIYADIQLSIINMLYLGFTGRNEWSTTLPKNNNSFFFPSVNAGFIFSELPFLKDNKFLSYGKIRASFAKIANHADPYYILNTFTSAQITDGWGNADSFPFNGIAGFTPYNVLANPDIKPETLVSREFGLEIKLLKNRANFDFSYYNNQNKDLLISVPITGSTGYNAQYRNAATMENKGIEIMANVIPVSTKDLTWGLTLNFSKNRNMVLSLAPGVTNIELGGFTGSTINVVAGETYGSMFSSSFYKDSQGRVIINDDPESSGYGYPIKDETMKSLGGVAPNWLMGISSDLSYKGIGFTFLFDIKNGGIMWDGTRGRLVGFGVAKSTEHRGETTVFEGVKGRVVNGEVVTEGEKNDIEAVLSQYYYSNIGGGASPAQEQYVEKTDWLRLREATLSYDMGKLIKNSFMKKLNLYFTGRNLWLKTPYKGIDPETNLMGAFNAQGLDYFNMPNTKSYVFGVKLDF